MSEFLISIGASGGGALGFTLGTSPTKVVAHNIQNTRLMFVNVSMSNTIYVCQQKDANGVTLTAGANPGNFPILPGAVWVFQGQGAQADWFAAASAPGTPLTVVAVQDGQNKS